MQIRVFDYIPELDAFKVNPQFYEICGELGLLEWGIGPIFIGRYIGMDEDYFEHFSDCWFLREEYAEQIKALGYDEEEIFFVDPERYQLGHDGPCHSPKMRKAFWTDLFKSLHLSLEFLFEEARRVNKRPWIDEEKIDVEAKIKQLREKLIP